MIEIIWQAPALALLLSYLLGSVPFGLVLTRLAGTQDLRTVGSGNIGATNVLRTGRKSLAAATLALDALKGAGGVWLAAAIAGQPLLGAVGAFLGHLYPVWLRFRGGKGVATLLGVLAALSWPVALVCAATWIAALLLSRYSSVGGMSVAVIAPVALAAANRFDLATLFLGLGLLVLWKHRGNLARLVAGTEPKIGRRAQ
ncbi:glycerol-3-phosphate acyltransferase PlsY [Sphingomonas jejuensis]|uniref:Glycerol-3-phosphate acyltransferase n=1 Tax=Sphingomonas jejuensis TaxID=904715 RepID=A0ABX0XKM1_9SPHN|nr:glycerol-3-phosphate 1-O-acyltransferase PlsY [Sphingomonas jejuensis]NJC33754.1 glycerol-3-phosphate acyltransferase PlsY [Sphingomonas jejuensis]